MSGEQSKGSPEEFGERKLGEKIVDFLIVLVSSIRGLRARGRASTRRLMGFRGPYGPIRGYFKSRPDKYSELRRSLNQARIGIPYDVYLTKSFYYSVVSGVLGAALGVFLTYLLWLSGALEGLRSPVRLSGSAASFASTYSTLIQGAIITFVAALFLGVITWVSFYYHPSLKAEQRRQSINVMLPHGIVFLYALNYGGMSIIEAIRELARSDDVYDEVANEFDMVVRDMDEFGSPLPIALQNARNLTPSSSMQRFFDDLLSTIDSGGDITKFLRAEGERYYQKAQDDQKDFIENLGFLGEIYATMFIAGPLLLIIILLVMSFVGAPTLVTIAVVTYVGIPLGVFVFGLMLHVLSMPYSWKTGIIIETEGDMGSPEPGDAVKRDPRYREYRRKKVLKSTRKFFKSPLGPVKRKPVLSLLVSVPAAVLTFVLLSGSVASMNEMSTTPIWTTTVLVVLPVLVAITPYSFFHEMKKARIRDIVSRYPEKLSAVGNANDMGMSLRDCFNYVSRRGSTEIDEEFGRVSNDITWKHDTSQALVDAANRLRVPQISRSMNLIAKASQTTGDLNRILETAAQDTLNEYRMKKQRAREMSAYITVIIVSFLVYLSVMLILDRYYLVPLYEAIPSPEESTELTQASTVGSLTSIPIETYRTLFLHSSLVLAFGNGLLAGKMGEDDVVAGLKYGIGFALLTVLAFWVIT